MNLCSKGHTAPQKSPTDRYCTSCRREYSRIKSAERRANGKYEAWKKQNPGYHTEYSRAYYPTMTEQQRAKHREQKTQYERTTRKANRATNQQTEQKEVRK